MGALVVGCFVHFVDRGGAVLCTWMGGGWLFTVYTGWAALSTVITGHFCCCTV